MGEHLEKKFIDPKKPIDWKIDVTQSYKLDKNSVLSEPDDTRKCPSCKGIRSSPLGFTLKSGKHHCRVCGAAICEEKGCSQILEKQWYCGADHERSKFSLTKITPGRPNNLEDEDPKKEKGVQCNPGAETAGRVRRHSWADRRSAEKNAKKAAQARSDKEYMTLYAHFPGSWDRQLGQVFIEKVNALHRAAHFTKMRGKAVGQSNPKHPYRFHVG